ncbi:MAG: efflux RND transporter periplasmic adaptor subunit [Pirellulales bacterium]|nr:efflux RND transporter periplasmic adaptor subunit [Pirellulales bacterium]
MWRTAKLAAIAAVAGGAVYWARFAPVPVAEHRVERGEIVAEVMGTGTLEAHFKSTISPRIAGRIQEVLADIGDSVTAGEALVRLDDVELKPQVEMAQASVDVAKATFDRLEADRSQALAVLEQTAAEHRRALVLLPKSAISKSDADKATAEWKTAQAGVTRTEAALVEAKKQLLAAEKNLAFRKALLDDTAVVAPFDGLIVQRQRDPGDVAVPGSAILSLISTEELWITAWVDETEMSRVAVGQPARVVFRSEPEKTYRGEVARLGRQADRETREYVVDVRVLELPKNWAVGQRAEVFIETARKKGVTVLPTRHVLWRDGEPGVLVHRDGRAAWRGLRLGPSGKESVEVVTGLEPGDRVIVPADGKSAAIEGRRVSSP